MTAIWVAGSDAEEAVIRLLLGFRDGVWYAFALELARERGARRVQLDANAANEPAQALYRR